MMNYALIGCGRISTNHIKAALNNNLNIIAVCDIVESQMENVLSKHNLQTNQFIKRYTDYKKMIDENKIDLISIATESGIHAEIALYCIEHKINVIIEKPMAMSIEDADKIIEAQKKYNVKVSACHQNRFNIAVQHVKKAIDEGRFGKISHGSIHVRWNRGKDYYNQAKWRGTWKDDGGCLMNQCIHGIDLLRWLLGSDVTEVYGVTRNQFHDYIEAEDVGIGILKFKSGVIASIEGTVNVYPKNLEETLYIFGEKGTVKIGGTSTNNIDIWEFADKRPEDDEIKNCKEQTSNVYGNGHTSLFRDMIEAINNDREPYVNVIAGKNALEIVLAMYKSRIYESTIRIPLDKFSSIDSKNEFVLWKVVKPKLTYEKQILYLKEKGVKFDFISERDALKYLTENNNYFKLTSYRKNYEKYIKKNKYKDLDFAYLIDLATIDMELRYILVRLALDIEHSIKLQLLNKITNDINEDGYTICEDYINNLSEYQRRRFCSEIFRAEGNVYTSEMYYKYHGNYPIWVLVEIISFGRLIDLYNFCAKRFDDEDMVNMYYMLKTCKSIRNASAHSNCILNDLKSNTIFHKTNNDVTKSLTKIVSISRQFRETRMSNLRIQEITTLLFVHNKIVLSDGIRKHQCDELNKIIKRFDKNKNYYINNELISSSFDFLKKVVDTWFINCYNLIT